MPFVVDLSDDEYLDLVFNYPNVSEWYRIVLNGLIYRLFRVINVYVKQNKRR
jgi:hypothetical protein